MIFQMKMGLQFIRIYKIDNTNFFSSVSGKNHQGNNTIFLKDDRPVIPKIWLHGLTLIF